MGNWTDKLQTVSVSEKEQRCISSEFGKLDFSVVSELPLLEFADYIEIKPMLVARKLAEIRPEDQVLLSLIEQIEREIKYFGRNRIPNEVMEGIPAMSALRPREHDPLGVYRPGDMWYVDENHAWARYFPVLILVPISLLILLVGIVFVARIFGG
jgi:hypothetical protein